MRLFFILWTIWLLPMVAFSQSCGLFDTIPIPANAQGDLTLTISDYFNDDLGSPLQGLCGIELHFLHSFSENLELTLTSPAGQSIDIIGPNTNDPFALTLFTKWKITFVPCGDTAFPDPGYLAQWDNDQPNNFVSGGQYSGSYYPYNGCLEDFDTGPVNGDWTLHFNNDPSTYIGAFLFVRLLFCDNRGVDCCFADAGNFVETEIISCEGDSSLIFEPTLYFEDLEPDTTQYDYVYSIAHDSLLIAYDSIINLMDYEPGSYQICGLSYSMEDLALLPDLDGSLRMDTLYARLNSFTAPFCGQLSDSCILVSILPPIPPTDLFYDLCEGDAIAIGDSLLTTQGLHPIHLSSEIGCDSLVNVTINLYEIPRVTVDSTICRGDSAQIGFHYYSDSGFYTDTLATTYLGCDSIVELSLTVLEPIFVDIDTTICQGATYSVGDSTFTQPNNYEIQLVSQQGCDSIVRLNLTVLDPVATILRPDTLSCTNSIIYLDGTASSPENISYEWSNSAAGILGTEATLPIEEIGSYILTIETISDGVQCTDQDTVQVYENMATPIANAGINDTLTCIQSTINLAGSNSSQGDTIAYQWRAITGNITGSNNTPNTTANAPGLYELTVLNIISGCFDADTVQISIDSISPTIVLSNDLQLNCQTQMDTIFSIGSSLGDNYLYEWASPDCQTDLAQETFLITDCAGKYYLTIENSISGCSQIDSVNVFIDTIAPSANIPPTDTLSCLVESVQVEGNLSTPSNITYFWEGLGISGSNTGSSITVNEPGTYQLIVSNTDNFCQDTTAIDVIQNITSPISDAGANQTITCNQPTATIGGGTTSNGQEFNYHWYTFDSAINGSDNQITLETDTSGTFLLEVINTLNGCRDTTAVEVFLDTDPPFVDAGNPMEFNCGDDLLTLTGNIGSMPEGNLSTFWSGPCLESPTDGLIMDISCAGTYYLQVDNAENGCANIDSVIIGVNPAALFAVLPDTTYLSCDTGEATIQGENSSLGFYDWIYEGTPVALTGSTPTVNEPGVYQLIISNLPGTCVDTAQTVVIFDCTVNINLTNTPEHLDCETAITTISTTTLPESSTYQFQWITADNNCILNTPDGPSIDVICEGLYTLIATNTNTFVSDTLEVNIIKDDSTPIAEAGLSDTITCTQLFAELDGSASTQGDSIMYFWTDNTTGDTLSTDMMLTDITSAGTFLLEVIDTANQCKSYDQAQVFVNNSDITLAFGPGIIPCMQDSFAVQVFADPVSDFYTYEWQGPSFFAPSTSSSVFVDSVGLYSVSATNTLSECSQTASISVSRQSCIPCFNIETPDSITCYNDTIELELTYCEPCIDCEIIWSTIDGHIVSGQNTTNPLVDMAGNYEVTVTDTLGFSTVNFVEVMANTTPPTIGLNNQTEFLTCLIDTLKIGLPEEINHTYSWSAINGGILASPTDTSWTLAISAGDYLLNVQDSRNGCIASDTLHIAYDTLSPIADAGESQYKTCDVQFVILDGSNSIQGSNYEYSWVSEIDQSCITGETTINPIVTCGGTYTLTVYDSLTGCQDTSRVEVILAEDIPTIQPIENIALTCDEHNATVTGNTPNEVDFIYNWCEIENGEIIDGTCQNTIDYPINQVGYFQFEITDTTTGCSNSTIITAFMDTLAPTIEVAAYDTIQCNESNINLSANYTPLEFVTQPIWYNEAGLLIENPNTLTPTVFDPGTYYISLENTENGCIAMDSILVIADETIPLIDAGIDTTLNCFHTEIRLNGSIDISTTNYAIKWESLDANPLLDATTPTPLISEPGSYTFEVTNLDNNCSSIDTLLVSNNDAKPTATIEGIDTLSLNCEVTQLPLNASISTSSNSDWLSYQWTASNGAFFTGAPTDSLIFAQQPGDYHLIVTDPVNGCMDTLNLALANDEEYPILIADLDPGIITCATDEVTIHAEASSQGDNFTHTWYNQMGEEIPTDELFLTVTTTGVYQLEIINETNHCKTIEEFTVDEDKTPPTAIIQPPAAINCQQLEVLLDGSNSIPQNQLAFYWSTQDGNINSEIETPLTIAGGQGTYQLLVTDQINGCKDSTTTQVVEEATLIQGMSYEIEPPDCSITTQYGNILLHEVMGGTPPFVINLDGSLTGENTQLSHIPVGDHILQIEDANGCTWEETIPIRPIPELILSLGADLTITLGDSTILTAETNRLIIDSIVWSPNDLFTISNGVFEQTVKPTKTTAYHVWVMDTLGCTQEDVILVNILKPRKVFIPNVFSPNGDGQNDKAMIFGSHEVEEIMFFQVFDRWGNMVFEAKEFAPNNPEYGWDGTLNGKDMNAGVFVYQLKIRYIDGWEEFLTGEIILMR